MHRKEFLKKASILTLGLTGLSGMSVGYASIKKWYDNESQQLNIGELSELSIKLGKDFDLLLDFLESANWSLYLKKVLGVNLNLRGNELKKELIKPLDGKKLSALRADSKSGFDDFCGERLVQPGFPAYSLLHHALASPRVRPADVTEYLSLAQIDLMENYIYALCKLEQLKAIYDSDDRNASGKKDCANKKLVLAIFAYEYRPAFKTPHHAYADMVFSRTGIGRLGDMPEHYDRINRCFTNRPANNNYIKKVAVTPARYGLFLARKVEGTESISLLEEKLHKGDDRSDDRSDNSKYFLQPERKLFNDDLLTGGAPILFEEYHISEKLEKLSKTKGIKMMNNRMPRPRFSKDLIVQDEKERNAGSSFLVISQHAPMIRLAKEDGKPLYFLVPEEEDKDGYKNRYHTALCTQKVEDVELLEGMETTVRGYNQYLSPRNQPLFVNITNFQKADSFHVIPKTRDNSFEKTLRKGAYYAPLFEDSICDGRVRANTSVLDLDQLEGIDPKCHPAFSVVTAPDFFPQVDPLDFEDFDVAPGLSKESLFYEGGVASLATARIKPNPKVIDTNDDHTRYTYLAVLSGALKKNTGISPAKLRDYQNPRSERGYEISGFLPDVASSVFAPGWDVTYCSLDDVHDIFIGTEGLGSPFIEDMKFCSALNGMWPATSPDAARTYQGSNETKFRNPTSVPLLELEIGICPGSPGGSEHACTGWDGEQGPYLEKIGAQWKVNFTDLGRADAVTNALTDKLDMSKLRKLTSAELINRMEALKLCIKALPLKNFNPEIHKSPKPEEPHVPAFTYLWLVSAEKVNWGHEHALGLGIPSSLSGHSKDWVTHKNNAKVKGQGYLYVFVNSSEDNEGNDDKEWTDNPIRRRLNCENIYVCQVCGNNIAWTEVKKGGIINWTII